MTHNTTAEYFDTFQPWYNPAQYADAVDVITTLGRNGDSLIDIGCGDGSALEFIMNKTMIRNVAAMDVSANYIARTKARLPCRAFLGSILDASFVASVPERFDFVLMGFVLHHLVGSTRRQSRKQARQAIFNCMQLLKHGGHLIVFEQAICPALAMNIVFYIKRLISLFTSRRLEILSHWANIGPPVVSYYTNEQLLALARQVRDARIVDLRVRKCDIERSMRLALITRKTLTTITLRKT